MLNQIVNLLSGNAWLNYLAHIGGFYLIAWIIHRLNKRLAHRIVGLRRFIPRGHRQRVERQETLQGLIASALSLAALAAATLASLGQFVRPDTLVWMVSLFGAAFGLAARPLISDVLAGVSILFEDTYAVGEKVEIQSVEGIIEMVNLRTTWLRAPTGELFVVPNGEVRLVRNFSRGRFSIANITLKVASANLAGVLSLMEELGKEAVALLPNLLEPWQVINVNGSGQVGQYTDLKIIAKARFGKAAEIRPRLLSLIYERLAEASIALAE